MDTVCIDVPAMYGDHHVIDVRLRLLNLSGVQSVYASSYAKSVEVTYDPVKITVDDIHSVLHEAGYLQNIELPQEVGVAAYAEPTSQTYMRHSMAFDQTKNTVGFGQDIVAPKITTVPCPGLKLTVDMEEKT